MNVIVTGTEGTPDYEAVLLSPPNGTHPYVVVQLEQGRIRTVQVVHRDRITPVDG